MLRITGGKVYDPANHVDGEVRDVHISEGRIVSHVDGGRTIDATGMVVLPGGVDVHTHVAGAALNFARAMTPETQRQGLPFLHTPERRMGLGGLTPTTFATGYLYAGMGYTTVTEAAVPVLSAKHTHEELRDTPILDKACLLLMANNEIVMDLLEAGETERAGHVVAWLIWAAKTYGVKAVNPGGVAAWKWGKNAKGLSDPIEGYSKVTPAKIIASLAGIVDDLGLPHPLHLHCNNLGMPGNVATTLETMKILEGRRAHMAHLQFHAYGGDDWSTMRSEAATIAEYFNAHPDLTADAGAILFGNAMTITADGPWQHLLHELTGRKWGNIDVENETGCGIVPYVYKKSSLVNAVQWAVGLELLLLITDPWRIFLTTDHPNGAGFWRYSGDRPAPDGRGLPPGAGEDAAPEGAQADRPGRSGPRVHALRDRDHHVRGARPGPSDSRRRGTSAWARTPTWRSTTRDPRAWRCSSPRATSSRAGRSWSRRARCGRWSRAGSSSSTRPTTPGSRSTCAPCSSSATRCRSTTIRSRRSASTACSSPSAGRAPDPVRPMPPSSSRRSPGADRSGRS